MKGFKNSTRMASGFKFPESAGFSSSSGKVQQVKGYTRQVVKRAQGGAVPMKQEPGGDTSYNTSKAVTIGDQGNSAQGRAVPISEAEKDHGGKTPLMPGLGYAMGGAVSPMLRKAIGRVTTAGSKSPAAPTAIPKAGMVRNALARRPMVMRAKGGPVSAPKAPPKVPVDPTKRGTTPMDALQGRKKQMDELGLKKGGFLGRFAAKK
jgi:hypothetical protein